MALLIFLALVAACFCGMVSMLGIIKRVSPAAYFVLAQDVKWRVAERKAGKDKGVE